MTEKQIAELLKQTGEIDKDIKLSSAERTVHRALKRIKLRRAQEKTLAPIKTFEELPEIKKLIEYQQAKGSSYKKILSEIRRFLDHLKTIPNLPEAYLRPISWTEDETAKEIIVKFLAWVRSRNVTVYLGKQALRRLFEALGRPDLAKNPLLVCKRSDLRPPSGTIERKDYLDIQEYKSMRERANEFERLVTDLHITLGCREGYNKQSGLLGLRWENVHWDRNSIDVWETKTQKSGILWTDCPLDLFFPDLPERLKKYWESKGLPKEGLIFDMTGIDLLNLWKSKGVPRAHDARHTHATWCRNMGFEGELVIGEYDGRTGKGKGILGVGWANPEVYFSRYGRVTESRKQEARKQALERFQTLFNHDESYFKLPRLKAEYR